jgi:hypothetical protein
MIIWSTYFVKYLANDYFFVFKIFMDTFLKEHVQKAKNNKIKGLGLVYIVYTKKNFQFDYKIFNNILDLDDAKSSKSKMLFENHI